MSIDDSTKSVFETLSERLSIASLKEEFSKASLPEVIEKIGLGPAQLRFVATGGGVWFADGAELLLISAVTSSVAAEWSLTDMQRGSIVTFVYMGVLFGNIISGPLGDFCGRRRLILSSYMGIFLFSIISSFSQSFWSLSLWRLFVGMSFGMGQPPWNVLGAEVTPTKWRVAVSGVSQLLFCFGEMYSGVLIWLDDPTMTHLDWRQLVQLAAIPSILFWIAGCFFLHESPFFMARAGDHEGAKETLRSMQHDNSVDELSMTFRDPVSIGTDEGTVDRWRVLCSGPLLATTAIMSYTCLVVNLIYYGCLYAFPNLLPVLSAAESSAPETSSAFQLIAGAFAEVPGIALAVLVGTRMERKPSLKIYSFCCFIGLMLFVGGAVGESHSLVRSWMWHCGYYAIKLFVVFGFTISYMYLVEVYPTHVRTTGTSFNIACGRVGAIVSPMLYEKLYTLTGSFATFFYVAAALTLVNLLLINFLPIETFGTSLSDTVQGDVKKAYGATEERSEA